MFSRCSACCSEPACQVAVLYKVAVLLFISAKLVQRVPLCWLQHATRLVCALDRLQPCSLPAAARWWCAAPPCLPATTRPRWVGGRCYLQGRVVVLAGGWVVLLAGAGMRAAGLTCCWLQAAMQGCRCGCRPAACDQAVTLLSSGCRTTRTRCWTRWTLSTYQTNCLLVCSHHKCSAWPAGQDGRGAGQGRLVPHR